MRRANLAVLITAVGLASSAGCGGSGRDAVQRWKDVAVKACDARSESIRVASAQLTAQSNAEQFTAFFQQFFEPAYRTQLDAMRRAGPPDSTASALVADTTAVLDAMKANPASYAVAFDPFADVDARWDAYGLKACGTRAP